MLRKVPDISDCRIGQTYACTFSLLSQTISIQKMLLVF